MATEKSQIVIKKYANRRLYNTRTSAYVTLDDLAKMVRMGEEFVVQDAKTGEDITRGVLGQIIFDAESRGKGLLPIAFLRQLITFYGDQMQSLVPTYLEHSLATFAREQEKFGRQINETLGEQTLNAVEDQVRRNMDMFQRSMRMFMPYGAAAEGSAPKPNSEEHLANDVAALRSELASMQAKIDALGGTGGEQPEKVNETTADPFADTEDDGFVVDSPREEIPRSG